MYFMVEDSWASFAASFGEEYADQVMAVMPMWSIILVIAGIFVFAYFGGLLLLASLLVMEIDLSLLLRRSKK